MSALAVVRQESLLLHIFHHLLSRHHAAVLAVSIMTPLGVVGVYFLLNMIIALMYTYDRHMSHSSLKLAPGRSYIESRSQLVLRKEVYTIHSVSDD